MSSVVEVRNPPPLPPRRTCKLKRSSLPHKHFTICSIRQRYAEDPELKNLFSAKNLHVYNCDLAVKILNSLSDHVARKCNEMENPEILLQCARQRDWISSVILLNVSTWLAKKFGEDFDTGKSEKALRISSLIYRDMISIPDRIKELAAVKENISVLSKFLKHHHTRKIMEEKYPFMFRVVR